MPLAVTDASNQLGAHRHRTIYYVFNRIRDTHRFNSCEGSAYGIARAAISHPVVTMSGATLVPATRYALAYVVRRNRRFAISNGPLRGLFARTVVENAHMSTDAVDALQHSSGARPFS